MELDGVAERRKKIAHGETMGWSFKKIQAPDGAAENGRRKLLSPQPGLEAFGREDPRLHRGLLLPRLRRWGRPGFEAHADGRK